MDTLLDLDMYTTLGSVAHQQNTLQNKIIDKNFRVLPTNPATVLPAIYHSLVPSPISSQLHRRYPSIIHFRKMVVRIIAYWTNRPIIGLRL
jgi:hypothetical protein